MPRLTLAQSRSDYYSGNYVRGQQLEETRRTARVSVCAGHPHPFFNFGASTSELWMPVAYPNWTWH